MTKHLYKIICLCNQKKTILNSNNKNSNPQQKKRKYSLQSIFYTHYKWHIMYNAYTENPHLVSYYRLKVRFFYCAYNSKMTSLSTLHEHIVIITQPYRQKWIFFLKCQVIITAYRYHIIKQIFF